MALPKSLCDREQDKFLEDSNGDTAVRVSNLGGDPLEVTVTSSTPGVKIHETGSSTGTSTVISTAVPASKTWMVTKVIASSRRSGLIEVKAGGSTIGSKRISPATMGVEFEWSPTRDITAVL